jgi:hypothetical protein
MLPFYLQDEKKWEYPAQDIKHGSVTMEIPKLLTTAQMAAKLGLGSGAALRFHTQNHPDDARPAGRFGNALLWTEDQIEILRQTLNRKRGRRRKDAAVGIAA